MESLKELYKVGMGPSSSHTIGPQKAAEIIKSKYQGKRIEVTLYSSLALTGVGHGTDRVIKRVLGDDTIIHFDIDTPVSHPNTLKFDIYDNNKLIKSHTYVSVGGGSIIEEETGEKVKIENIYPYSKFNDRKKYIAENNMTLPEYVFKFEDEGIKDYLLDIYKTMVSSIENGLKKDGVLPGGLNVKRKAKSIYNLERNESSSEKEKRLITAYSYAAAEENASGGVIVTAPTCGASGIVPAAIYYLNEKYHLSNELIVEMLAVAGLFGNIVKDNASISGAYAGCQSEVGTACSMAAAMIAYYKGMALEQIEAAAEIAMEHHLGLTCDPVKGLVQIPCIERNAVATLRAFDAALIASLPIYPEKLSFDSVVKTMFETGRDINSKYRETSQGGLAKVEIKE